MIMKGPPDELIVDIAIYIKKTNSTVRKAAKFFNIPKSNIHKYMTENIKSVSGILTEELREILLQHKVDRACNGGKAFREMMKTKKQAL